MRIFLTALAFFLASSAFAQSGDTTVTIQRKANALPARPGDHFMFQFGYTNWLNKPDSVHTTGFSRSFNVYIMFDLPFKTNPHFSAAIGPGLATDNIFLNKTYLGLKDNTSTVRFQDLSDTTHFKKYKLATAYLEAPVELRWRSNVINDNKAVKVALGIKVGYLVNAHTKGKTWESSTGTVLLNYIDKQNNAQFLNGTRISASARIGYGHFSLFGSYSITPVFKQGAGPQVRPLTLGLTLSGL